MSQPRRLPAGGVPGDHETEPTDTVSNLVDEYLGRGNQDRRRPLPIVLLCGPRDSGQSELLEYLETRFKPGRPCVRQSEPLSTQRPHQIALLLAFHLSERVKCFGRLKFPRLFLGVAATRGPVNFDNRAATRAEMIKRIVPDRKLLKKLICDTAPVLINLVGTPLDSRLHKLAVEAMLAVIETVPLPGGRHLRWYRGELRKTDAVDALVALAKYEADNQLGTVDEVLCRAFLADLRDECTTRFPRPWNRDKNCLALLGDADSDAARGFLDVIAAQRQGWDPLLIVATSSTRPPTANHHSDPEHWVVQTLDSSGSHFAAGGSQPYRDDVDVAGVLGGADKALRFACRLTEGHHGGMKLVLRTMSRRSREVGAENVDVRGLFEWTDPRANRSVLPDEALQLLIGNWPVRIRRALIRSTAARDFGDEELAEALRGAPPEIANTMVDFRSRDLWVRHSPTQRPTLHPFPRRAVIHLLTAPPRPGDPTWDDVHRRMQVRAGERGDTTSAMYHFLARGETLTVAEYLSELFMTEDTQRWFQILQAITEAPLAHPASGKNSEEHWQLLLGDADDRLVVRKALVSALQLHNDPLGDPCHALCPVIAQELEELARDPRRGALTLYTEARKFRRCSSQWESS